MIYMSDIPRHKPLEQSIYTYKNEEQEVKRVLPGGENH
jgi:hypothetical protein